MKAAGLHHSLKDLSAEIGNCERNLSRAMKGQDTQTVLKKNQIMPTKAIKSSIQQQTDGAISSSCCQKRNRLYVLKTQESSKAKHDRNKNLLCKEIITDKRSATQVQVVVQTKPLKKRSRSAQSSKPELLSGADSESVKCFNTSGLSRNNPSWSHILKQQSHVPSLHNKDRKAFPEKKGITPCYSSSDGLCNDELDNWIRAVPLRPNTRGKPSKESINGNMRSSEKLDGPSSIFNPVRTLNFLVKELRGKVHKNYDENMQRIVKDMEEALHSIPFELIQSSCNTQLVTMKETESSNIAHESTPARPRTSLSNSSEKYSIKNHSNKSTPQVEAESIGYHCLVDILTSTVARVKDLTRSSCVSVVKEDCGTLHSNNDMMQNRMPNHRASTSVLQSEIESNCKQLEETCRQMQEQCENLRQQLQQAHEEIQKKTLQLEASIGKNRQLIMYSADVRQEMLLVQQAAELLQQQHDTLRLQLMKLQHESQDSNGPIKKRLEDMVHENERLSTELHLSQLERDKMRALLSSKDLEVAKLKKEIVGISALVSEQLSSLCTTSQQNKSVVKLNKTMRNVEKFFNNDQDGTINHSSDNYEFLDSSLKNACEDEGNRTRPVCSSPTSSINSSLYCSWQLSDISGADGSVKKHKVDNLSNVAPTKMLKRNNKIDNGCKEDVVQKNMDLAELVKHDWISSVKDPTNLKADLQDMFRLLKKRAAEAVNVTLPSPPQEFTGTPESVEFSHWTELSASESTLLNSSDESQGN